MAVRAWCEQWWPGLARRASFRLCRGPRVYGIWTTTMHSSESTPPPSTRCPPLPLARAIYCLVYDVVWTGVGKAVGVDGYRYGAAGDHADEEGGQDGEGGVHEEARRARRRPIPGCRRQSALRGMRSTTPEPPLALARPYPPR